MRTAAVWVAAVTALVVLGLAGLNGRLWFALLQAPQYPQGLGVAIAPSGVTGDVAEVDTLNHYVGLRPFAKLDLPELALWRPTLVAVFALALLTLVLYRRRWRWVSFSAAASVPFGMLAVAQWRLYQLGHTLNPDAPLETDPFTPLVVGPSTVANFRIWAFPGRGIVAIALMAAVSIIGAHLLRRFRTSARR